ncbi:MAG: SDR family NAD(P)-dependent oxidoreductase [Acidobacteria bacterium]|nr:SDR family NAD(P)-dependent oxidoreductase [Acidobacteriota bacterium]
MRLEGRVVVLTGAGAGIGRELALILLSRGAKVAGVDLNAAALAETKSLAGHKGGGFEGFIADITDRSAVERLPEIVRTRFGTVDAVINNAGIIQPFLPLMDLDYPTIDRLFSVNLLGTLYVLKTFLPNLIARPEAHIVNLSSMGGFVPVPGQTIYCAAKAGVKLMSEGLASELLNSNVRVTVVFPGAVATNIAGNSGIKARGESKREGRAKPMSAAKAAEIIVDAVERNAHHVYVGRDSSMMNMLTRLDPQFAARALAKKLNGLLSSGDLAATNQP